MSDEITLQEPWSQVSQFANNLEQELKRELSTNHPLHGCNATAVAQRTDSDDVLFQLENSPHKYAVVHLTWSGQTEPDARWPDTRFFKSIQEWSDQCMKPDHLEFVGNGDEA